MADLEAQGGRARPHGVRSPLIELTRARLLEFVRDPSALFWVFGFPILLAIALGIAFRNHGPDVTKIALTGPAAPLVAQRVKDQPTLHFVVMTPNDAKAALRSGRVDLLVVAESSARAPNVPQLTYRFDPSRPNATAVRVATDDAIQRAFGRSDVAVVAEEHVSEAGGRYIDFLIPGLIGLNVMGSCLWGLGYAIVDARRRKLLKRFAVTPMNRAHFLLSFMLSRLIFLILEVTVLVAFGWIAFGVAVRGSIGTLALIALVGSFAFSGIAVLIAARTESTETASGWMNFVQLPMWLFSGSFFMTARFPDALQPFIKALPLTAINSGIRAVMNDGASLTSVGLELGVLAAYGVLSFFIALKVFRWQ